MDIFWMENRTKSNCRISGKVTLELAADLEDVEHELLLFKRMDSCHTFKFYGFELSEGAELLR